jgi:hypothetical protein
MKKPVGVTASAVFALLGSLLMLACLVLVGLTLLLSPGPRPLPAEARLGMTIGFAMFGIMAAWGTTTAIGLFRLRNWARVSMLVFAALLAVMGVTGGPMILLIPPLPTAPPNFGAVRVAMAAFYAALGLLGVFWLYYFGRRATRQAFAGTSGGAAVVESGGRPLSISIIGWWFLLSGVIGVLASPLKMPAMMFIWIMSGWTAAIWQLAFGALWAYVGYGLLRLMPTARKIAVTLICFGAANAVVFFMLPGRDVRLAALMSRFRFSSQSSLPPHFMNIMIVPMAIAFALPLWFLIIRRDAFEAF